MTDAGRNGGSTCRSPAPPGGVKPLRVRETLLCGLLLATVGVALWIGRPVAPAARESRATQPGAPDSHAGAAWAPLTDEERFVEWSAAVSGGSRRELTFRIAAPSGATLAELEYSFEKTPGDAPATGAGAAHGVRGWAALAGVLALVTWALLPRPEQQDRPRRPQNV